jgi:hypothetical protein
MGFTRYWKSSTAFDPAAFAEFASDARRIVDAARLGDIDIAGPLGEGDPVLTDEEIALNGRGDNGHETFAIGANDGPISFDFCKTARKPYDVVVCAILLRAERHLGLSVSGDGDEEDDRPGHEVVARLFGNS